MTTVSQFKKHTHRDHILELPDTYIGSIDTNVEHRWIWNAEKNMMEWRSVSFCPGFFKIFDEIMVNALDHRVRQSGRVAAGIAEVLPVKHIDVTISSDRISVRNDGDGIPVETHTETGLWGPELIFGNLLTSSNYDKSEEKVVGGKNGYGAKLTNIFSREFIVETVDHRQKKKYVQTWTSNMSSITKPKITASALKPYTTLTYVPDLSRFHWGSAEVPTAIPADMLSVLATRVIDAAACAGKECRITLNGTAVATNTFPKYIQLYLSDDTASSTGTGGGSDDGAAPAAAAAATTGTGKRVAFEAAGERWEIGAILTSDLHGDAPPKERHVSFVNGIATRRGGTHLDYIADKALSAFCEHAKKKSKLDITPGLLRDSVVWFINSTIVNPSFDTQTKETLTTPSKKFGSLPVISPKFADQLVKIGLLDEATALLDAKQAKDVKKTDGRKLSTVRGIPKLDDATLAGTGKSAECTLILTEGDSAKTTAISGLQIVGRERYGVFPLRGKVLNVKDISAEKKANNTELANIKKILGLQTGKKYTSLSELRYGRIMIMTDQDVDGSHIKGLLMNLFHTEWPELLKLGFLCCLMTPLLKAFKGTQTLCFYSESEFEEWKAARIAEDGDHALRGWTTKYYKGLATSTQKEAREYFKTMNTVEYTWDHATSDGAIDLAFNKKRADDRKTWLATFDRKRHLEVELGGAKVDYARFVNDELIHFSNEDNIRSLPHVMDGLKPSQRKILWSALKRNLTSEIRVAQLAGYVSEHAAYHHGEASLNGAIIGMAQNFVGSNNINLFAPNGQFGTRLMGGQDAGAPRYIHTELMPIVRALIKKEDAAILEYTEDDGLPVEPVTYMPVLPTLLINGSIGIGTGFSTQILQYNPADLLGAFKYRLSGGIRDLSSIELIPWWFGFKGRVVAGGDGKTWITRGIYEFVDDDSATIRIKELPIGTWTQDYKDFLEGMLTSQEEALAKWRADTKKGAGAEKPTIWLKGYDALYNDVDVDFVLHMDADGYHTARAYTTEFESAFKLSSKFKTTNMVAFDLDSKIHRFISPGEIMEMFYGERLRAYGARKTHEVGRMTTEITELEARLGFIRAVVEKRLVVANAPDAELLAGLRGLGLPPISDTGADAGLKGYEYLLKMRIDRIKAAAVAELERDVAEAKAARDILLSTSVEALWLKDLDEFSAAWDNYCTWRNSTYDNAVTSGAVATKKKTVRKVTTKAAVKK